MASKKAKLSEDEQVALGLETARRALADTGVASGAKLGPAKLRARVIAQLQGEGFEKAGAKLRVPLTRQVEELLSAGAHIAFTHLAKRLKGATAVEAKKIATAIVREGKASLVLRGKQISLVSSRERTLTSIQLETALREAKLVFDGLKKVKADKLPLTLLMSDYQEMLGALSEAVSGEAAPRSVAPTAVTSVAVAPGEATSWQTLRGALLALQDEDSGLISVPAASQKVREFLSVEAVKQQLLRAHRDGELELRPEGGIARLSEEHAALCPTGAGGVPLSWARLLGA